MPNYSTYLVEYYNDLEAVLEAAGHITIGTKNTTPTVSGLASGGVGEDTTVNITNYDSDSYYGASASGVGGSAGGTTVVSGSSIIWTLPSTGGDYTVDVRAAKVSYIMSEPGQWSIFVSDPLVNDSNCVLLMHFENNWTDDSAGGSTHSFSTYGSPGFNSTYKKFGTYSQNNNGGVYTANNKEDFQFGDGDFTIDLWLYNMSNGSFGDFISYDGSGGYGPWNFVCNGGWASGRYDFSMTSASKGTGAYDQYITYIDTGLINAWHHWAIVRKDTEFKLFVDGVEKAHKTNWSGAISTTGDNIWVRRANMNEPSCYIDELRISKGVARWWANFNVPTSPYPDPA